MNKLRFLGGVLIAIWLILVFAGTGVAFAAVKPLNNFVTVLIDQPLADDPHQAIPFDAPRNGWLFIAIEGDRGDETPQVQLDNLQETLTWRTNPVSGVLEAMLQAHAGTHVLHVFYGAGRRVHVRAIPELIFCYYPSSSHISAYGPYTWDYMERHVFPEVNTLVSTAQAIPDEFQQWLKEGRQWISNAHLPGLGDKEPPTVEEVFTDWVSNSALTGPGYGGLIVDEFTDAPRAHYAVWDAAVKMLYGEPTLDNRTFYAWCTRLYETPHEQEFARTLLGLNARFAWEIYLCEEATESEAVRQMRDRVAGDFQRWKETFPGIEKNMVLCLGYLSAPPETLNLDPRVDYHVFLDMQFQMLATEPVFKDIYGVMEYMAAYADEESLQYAHRLMRHYCIEGKTTRMNTDPYILSHLKNPDFEEGLLGWELAPAAAETLRASAMERLSWLQGRYPKTPKGDTCCLMTRSENAPNQIRQTITGLQKGRLYSVKVLSANLDALDQNKKTSLALQITDAEILPALSFQCVYPSCYSHETEIYTRDHPAYFSFHRVVFRAQATEALLTLSDWLSATTPEDTAGTVTAFNFVEVQPCHLAVD